MKAIISISMSVAIVGHSLFDCCAQGEHHRQGDASLNMLRPCMCCNEDRGVGHDHSSQKRCNHPCGPVHHDCSGGFTSILSGNFQLDNVLVMASLHSDAIMPAILDTTIGGHTEFLTDGPLEQVPSVRRHLLLQVLLT